MSCRTGVRWLYKLDQTYGWDSRYAVPHDLVFLDDAGMVRLIIEKNGRITVTRDYAWNGCSPKFCFFDLMLGTPEGVVHAETEKPKTYYASLVHDALYQFLPHGLPLKRRQADRFFWQLLRESDFGPARLYWLAVRALGWLVRLGTKRKRQWQGSSRQLDELLQSVGETAA